MHIIHFDVDTHLQSYISGSCYPFSVDINHIDDIKEKEHIQALSCKSASYITAEVLKHVPQLKLIITRTVGADHIDLTACKEKHIAVYHIPDYGAHNIAEHAFGLLIAGARCIVKAHNHVHTGTFSYKPFFGTSLKDRTLGVLGTGKIGLELIKRAQAFGMRVIASDKKCNVEKGNALGFACVSLDELLAHADMISLHIPLLPETKHLINEERIMRMKDGVILVNTARGGIIDTQALIKHIKKFKAVCLDVLEDERSFSLNHPLLAYDNVIITPHIGFYTDNALYNIARETAACVKRFEQGGNEGRVV